MKELIAKNLAKGLIRWSFFVLLMSHAMKEMDKKRKEVKNK